MPSESTSECALPALLSQGLRASISMDFNDSGCNFGLLFELRSSSLWPVAVGGCGNDRQRKTCRDGLRGPMLSSHSYRSVLMSGCTYAPASGCPFMGMCWSVVAMLWGMAGVLGALVISPFLQKPPHVPNVCAPADAPDQRNAAQIHGPKRESRR